MKKGEPVVLVFHTQDVTHGFKIPDLNIKADDIKLIKTRRYLSLRRSQDILSGNARIFAARATVR